MPAIYSPKEISNISYLSILVPHFNDLRSDKELKILSGCDFVLRPKIKNNIKSIENFIDYLFSAEFILCGSLHAAIIAMAYGKPFGFWDSGNIDIPFKWKDLSASAQIPCHFLSNKKEAESFYNDKIKYKLRIPILWPMLVTAPYLIQPKLLAKVIELDFERHGNSVFSTPLPQSTAVEIEEKFNHAERDYTNKIKGIKNQLSEQIYQNKLQLQKTDNLDNQLAEAKIHIETLKQSHSWRLTLPLRLFGSGFRILSKFLRKKVSLSKASAALLLLPTALVFYDSFSILFKQLLTKHGTFTKVITNQVKLRERLLSRNRFLRLFVFACFALAIRIQRTGSLKRCFTNCLRIINIEGLAGIINRIKSTAPSMSEAPIYNNDNRPIDRPALLKEVSHRILVIDYRVPRHNQSAGEMATVGICKDLCALGYETVFLSNDMIPSPCYEESLQKAGVKVITHSSGFDSSAAYLEKYAGEFGVFYLIRLDVAEKLLPIVRRVAPHACVIFHSPDLYFLREMREAKFQKNAAAQACAVQMRDRELAVMRRSDHLVVVSTAELSILDDLVPNTPASLFPALYAPVSQNCSSFKNRENIFFLGGFAHSPNVCAVRWFATEIWPYAHSALPHLEFHIIGAEAPNDVIALQKLPGVKVLGFVSDLNSVLDTYRIGVAPLLYGAGIKGKVAVTMGAGIPCVCTKVAVEGMGIMDNIHALVQNDPVCFAKAIISLYDDENTWSHLSRNGQELINNKFSEVANRTALLNVLNQAYALPIFLFKNYCQKADPSLLPALATEVSVDISIIIPSCNTWHVTRACLVSVILTCIGSDLDYEIILVDHGSTGEAIIASKAFTGLRVIKMPRNLNFPHK